MQGGLRVECNTVTFYKNVTSINIQQEVAITAKSIPELDLDYEEFHNLQEIVYYNLGQSSEHFKVKFRPLLQRFEDHGLMGDAPLKHWEKNQIKCKLEIINPYIIIQDKPLKHVTPAMAKAFDQHVQALLKLG